MGIGGENHIGKLRRSHIQRFAEVTAIDEKLALNLYGNIATAILDHLPTITDEAAQLPEGRSLAQRLVPKIRQLCEKSLAVL